jgi:triosephosphate isomerase
MKHVYLNLKRFDISPARGGVNRVAPVCDWGAAIVKATRDALAAYPRDAAEFTMFFPEAHLLSAAAALGGSGAIRLGCQGVYREDTAPGGNFGAFTTHLTANAAAELGCESALIGHCEERADKAGVLAEAGVADAGAVNRLLNREVLAAQKAGLSVLYCVGEKTEEQPRWQAVLAEQLQTGLKGADRARVVIAYEPVWSIGPGKTPADEAYIRKVAAFIKETTRGMDVVYGGGLKADNAAMLASIPQVDGGLIALTRFVGEIGFYPEEYLRIIRLYLGERPLARRAEGEEKR